MNLKIKIHCKNVHNMQAENEGIQGYPVLATP